MRPGNAVNLICGPNASGKTSLLEAIHLLGRGRSFRTPRTTNIIRKGASKVTVFGEVEPLSGVASVPVGLSKSSDGSQQLKVAGEALSSTAPLLKLLPLQLINPDTFGLLAGGPKSRREYVDWGVFHVEHLFLDVWQRFNRCLRQRNSLLRQGKARWADIMVWDRELVECAGQLNQYRLRYLERLLPVFNDLLQELAELDALTVSFYPGWDKVRPLAEVLEQGFEADRTAGYTHAGPQRADLKIRYLGQRASDTLSRGQQKLVVAALKLAQGQMFTQSSGRHCVYLVDDLAAELDEENRAALCRLLAGLGSQLFLTVVDEQAFSGYWGGQEVKMFHVKHGIVSTAN